ncbi:BURP domain-containing protein 9-like [Ricinus communis]|uniref:BURP domain-containing protein 9-like n=1 Tax=Ricinus communis TaxID=3988 RepID=UPI00201AFCEC|nr:BURP domain-containing protein 9-like [Ricinus communis]
MGTMAFHLLPIFALFCVMISGSKASLPAEDYWHSKLPNTPIPQELLKLLQPADLGGNTTFWDMGFNDGQNSPKGMDEKRKNSEKDFMEGSEDKRSKYGRRYDEAFVEGTDDKRQKYGKRYDEAFVEGVDDKRAKYGKRYDEAFVEGVDDKRAKYGKRYDEAFVKGVDDKRAKYGKRYDEAFVEGVDDKRAKYGKRYDEAFTENVDDKREKYGKRYDEAFTENVDDRREKYGKRYDEAFTESVDDRREKYGKRYDEAFTESVDDKRQKYGKRYDEAFVEGTDDKRQKYGKRYDEAFVEGTDDKRQKYGKRYDEAFVESVDDKRQKYGKRYETKFNKHALPNSTVFFLQKDLHVGQKMKLHITKSTNEAKFLPRKVAESIPFSSKKIAEMLERFSVKPESLQAKIIKKTVDDCESVGIKGEDRFCPTSLESLIDFTVSHIGNKAQVLYNEVDKPTRMQEYTIMGVKMVGENQVVCHKQKYPYALYYCHSISATKVYTAPLVGADGTKAKAVVVCHSDTSNWNPGHLAFLMLKIKPGEGTVCHFIRSDTLVWSSN